MSWSVVVGDKVYDVIFKKVQYGLSSSDYVVCLSRHNDADIKIARVIKGLSGGWDVLPEIQQGSKWTKGFYSREHATRYALTILGYYK